jgi:hypothetical protein
VRCPIRAPYKHVGCAKMLVLAQNDEVLPRQRVERVSDGDFMRENSGSMSSLRMAAHGIGLSR